MQYYLYKSSLLSYYLENFSGLLLRKAALEFLVISWKTSVVESILKSLHSVELYKKNGLQWRFQAVNFSKCSEQLILGAHKDSSYFYCQKTLTWEKIYYFLLFTANKYISFSQFAYWYKSMWIKNAFIYLKVHL